MAIEPLSIALRSSLLLRGVGRGGEEHRVSLYADDLLIYVSNPGASAPVIVSLLNNLGYFSGYKLNYQKSECFPINDLAIHIKQGINITRSFTSLLGANFTPLNNKMKADFRRWSSLPLTIAGKVQSVKMNVLRKYLYLFQSLPLFLTKSFFQSVNTSITSFTWNNKFPTVNKGLLQRGRDVGGLPSFIHYYWAANLQNILFWLHVPDGAIP